MSAATDTTGAFRRACRVSADTALADGDDRLPTPTTLPSLSLFTQELGAAYDSAQLPPRLHERERVVALPLESAARSTTALQLETLPQLASAFDANVSTLDSGPSSVNLSRK
jgi:hypothetical protein